VSTEMAYVSVVPDFESYASPLYAVVTFASPTNEPEVVSPF